MTERDRERDRETETSSRVSRLTTRINSEASMAQPRPKRDGFFWLGQINKASIVTNTAAGLLDEATARTTARGLVEVLEAGDSGQGPRPGRVITFEPLLVRAAGVQATLVHAGRSSQDMLMTTRTAQLRGEALRLGDQLCLLARRMVELAREHSDTLVPSYTNGVAAQPTAYGHVLLGHAMGFLRDADRLRQFHQRLALSPMGSTVCNGTGWPLDRAAMASLLGFRGVAVHAYDAVQIRAPEMAAELGAVASSMALHVGAFVQDVVVQYAQPRPWILLREGGGNTYASSAMPQKRNPGLLSDTRAAASRVLTLGMGRAMAVHNVVPGMVDGRVSADNLAVARGAAALLADLRRVLDALVVDADRARGELDADWTASQELADVLMRDHGVPFRVGHHFASEMVSAGREGDVRPSAFPYEEARRLYAKACRELDFSSTPGGGGGGQGRDDNQEDEEQLPLSEEALRATLDPAAIVRSRATMGGPQPAEMERMLAEADESIDGVEAWIQGERRFVKEAMKRLEGEFARYLED